MGRDASGAYQDLISLWRRAGVLASCADVLDWDTETMLPRGGVENRSEQSAVLAAVAHDHRTSHRIADLLDKVESSDLCADPESDPAVIIREIRREYDRLTRLPSALVAERARLSAIAQHAWAMAKDENDFAHVRPWLEQCVSIARQEGAALSTTGDPMQGLLGQYEPDLSVDQVVALLDTLRRELSSLRAALASQALGPRRRPRPRFLGREFPIDRQKLFAQAVAAALGFDQECGRIDVGAHPSCVHLGPGDTRLTARYADRNFGRGFFAVLHEVGHALYDQGLPREHHALAPGQAPSLGAHESQARLWENFVGHSRSFWDHFYPRLRNVFPEALGDVDPDSFFAAINRVEPTHLRAEADEVTYNLHIAIRFDLERALIAGTLRVVDLPGAWVEASRQTLGIVPPSDTEGCLQDGHWFSCMFGYFPTYALGNVYAAQLMGAARRDLPDLDASFSSGDFRPLLAWLRDNVHRHGHRLPTSQLMRRATGRELACDDLVSHLRFRYLA